MFSNRLLLWGIAFELTLAAMVIYLPPLQQLLSTAALPPRYLLVTVPFPFIVWGADELRRYLVDDATPPRRTRRTALGIETDSDARQRHELLRRIGYKL